MKLKGIPALSFVTVNLGIVVVITALAFLGCSSAKTTSDMAPAPDFSGVTVTVFESPT